MKKISSKEERAKNTVSGAAKGLGYGMGLPAVAALAAAAAADKGTRGAVLAGLPAFYRSPAGRGLAVGSAGLGGLLGLLKSTKGSKHIEKEASMDKLAQEQDAAGRIAARGFSDELRKLASIPEDVGKKANQIGRAAGNAVARPMNATSKMLSQGTKGSPIVRDSVKHLRKNYDDAKAATKERARDKAVAVMSDSKKKSFSAQRDKAIGAKKGAVTTVADKAKASVENTKKRAIATTRRPMAKAKTKARDDLKGKAKATARSGKSEGFIDHLGNTVKGVGGMVGSVGSGAVSGAKGAGGLVAGAGKKGVDVSEGLGKGLGIKNSALATAAGGAGLLGLVKLLRKGRSL